MATTELENEYILLLVCKTCKSIEELPYVKTGKYLGMVNLTKPITLI